MPQAEDSRDRLSKVFLELSQAIIENRSPAKFGLTRLQASTIHKIYNHNGITMSQLADAVEITRPQLTRVIDSLETRDLVQRQHNPENHRIVNVLPTTTGARIHQEQTQALVHEISQKIDSLSTEEQIKLNTSLRESVALMAKAGIIKHDTSR